MEAEIWVEKYRPKTLDEIVGQDEVIRRLKSYVKQKNIPHLLFAGPPGTGKTATAIALARDLFGENWRDNFIEMNASVTPDTLILVRINGVIKRTTFEEIDRLFFEGNEEYVVPIGLETLSFREGVGFYPVSFIARHKADRILRIRFEGGEVKVTPDHSVMVLDDDGRIIPKRADELKKGDFLLSLDGYGLPSEPFKEFFRKADYCIGIDWSLPKDRAGKSILLKVLESVRVNELEENEVRFYMRLKALAESSLYAVEIKEIERLSYDGWVYDFSVPNSEVFFGGTTPVLLHNSDERGIDVVRHKIKEFARTAPIGGAPFKIIFLDEADALTADAQAALRRTMEMYSKTCRFILSCNYVSRIIEPIQSRCAVFKFKPVPPEAMKKRLLEIAEKEGLKITEDGLEALIYIANGDFRKAINALQGAAAFGEVIDAEAIYQITATARPEEIKKLIETALEGKFMEARQMLDRMMVEYGMSGEDVVTQMFREIISSKLDERLKVMLIDRLGEIDFRLTEGAHDRIQLDAYLAYLATVGKKRGT